MQRATASRADSQMPLPFALDGWNENELRTAHRNAHLRIPFEAAIRQPALAICLRCFSEAQHKQRPPGER